MRISVIIPTYNSAALVVEAVESVLAQTRPADEVFVIDDGSTDDTAQRLRRFGERIRYVYQANARVAAARNHGLRLATGELIAFLDADDAWHPQKLARQAEAMERHAEIGLLATQLTAWPGEFVTRDVSGNASLTRVPLERMLLSNPIATSSIVVRRSVIDQVGNFDTELFGPEDYDLWLRCAQMSGVAVLEDKLTGYRDVAGSLGKQAETMHRGLRRIHAKLDNQDVWQGKAWLRRKCQAHVDYTTGYMFYESGSSAKAVALLVQSLVKYPLPMQPPDVRYRWARLRLLARCLLATVTPAKPRMALESQ